MSEIKTGDIVVSLAGRDEGVKYLVIKVEGKFVYLLDGKLHVKTPKKKNVKHVKNIESAQLIGLAEDILKGNPVGAKRLQREIKSVIK